MQLDADNIEAYALGCAILSAGGGGDPAIGLVMARHAIAGHGPVPVTDPADLDPAALVMPCGLIGSPTVAQERIWNGAEGAQLARSVAGLHDAPVDVLMCYEIAGVNGLLPVLWAARLGTPLLDADGMGRAFPEMQQQAMHVAGVAASPVVLTDGLRNVIVVEAADNQAAERLARSCAASFGGTCAGALYVMTGRVAATAAIPGSVSRALQVGTTMRGRTSGWSEALADETGGRVLLEGRVTEIERSGGAGFARGHAVVDGSRGRTRRRLRLEMQNEVLAALEDGEVLATVPDIIAVLGLVNGRPVGTERLQYGQRVAVVALPAPAVWRSEQGLRVVGPRSFGYDLDYVGGGRHDTREVADADR
ncbi:DUF917 domain-containing protein [uncultured Pseudonocardia sp.]|uniref:DUF917 domain-containing protein n=1 Tax=uncultured Pseudonocardia sp. TaxID=211455 RepID=UPI002623E9A6|nr:DUF917 domain-containing protein [uncultured Pseudonocardia sp.]